MLDEDGGATAHVRPYALTGGRVRAEGEPIALEALVVTVPPTDSGDGDFGDGDPGDADPGDADGDGPRPGGPASGADLTGAEKARILATVAAGHLSVAELSAHLRLPVGVVRVLVGDLVADGRVSVHPPASATGTGADRQVLENVLDGLRQL